MATSFNEAAGRTCPHGNGSGEMGQCYATPVTAASSAAVALVQPTGNGSGFYCTFISTVDAHIRFGYVSVGAATQSDYLLRANIPDEWYCEKSSETHFRLLRDTAATADGVLYHYRSSR